MMHAARLAHSERLQRVDALLVGGGEYSTLEIIQQAGVCAVNSIISELRNNGRDVRCKCVARGVYVYWIPREDVSESRSQPRCDNCENHGMPACGACEWDEVGLPTHYKPGADLAGGAA